MSVPQPATTEEAKSFNFTLSIRLEYEWNDGLPAKTLVLLVVGLAVALVFLHCPIGHLHEAHQREGVGEGDLRHDREAYPGEHLERVVWTRDVLKEKPSGDWTFERSLGWTEVAEHDVADEVSDLADEEDGQTHVDEYV